MKEKIKEIALQVGGSHYPDVGGELLQKFADAMIAECIQAIQNTPTHCAHTTHDLGTVKCTIDKTVQTVKAHFQ